MTQSLLGLLQPGAGEGLSDAVGPDVRLVLVHTIAELFEQLRSEPRNATLISLAVDGVDEATVRTAASQAAAGSLLLSAPGASLERSLLSERVGAVGLLREPFDPQQLRSSLRDVLGAGPEVLLPTTASESDSVLIGSSSVMSDVFAMIARVSRSDSTVLLTGESGTGKELAARALHRESDRADAAFVPVNCAAIPEHLLESELFGHEKGAFTGAVARHIGRFQRADRGTLFLDEIGDMSLVLQAKLLRALEEGVVEPVGGERAVTIDVRVVAATNQALPTAIADGRFREDLYYRLGVVEIELPPLREREGDVRELALHFARAYSKHHGRRIRAITSRALERLESAGWRGNVRELRNVIDRAVLLTTGDVIRSGALRLGTAAPRTSPLSDRTGAGYPAGASLAEVEADHIRRALSANEGHIGKTADLLGVHRNTLARKIRDYGLSTPRGEGP